MKMIIKHSKLKFNIFQDMESKLFKKIDGKNVLKQSKFKK